MTSKLKERIQNIQDEYEKGLLSQVIVSAPTFIPPKYQSIKPLLDAIGELVDTYNEHQVQTLPDIEKAISNILDRVEEIAKGIQRQARGKFY